MLHVIWTYFILKIVYKAMYSGKVSALESYYTYPGGVPFLFSKPTKKPGASVSQIQAAPYVETENQLVPLQASPRKKKKR